MTAWYELMNLSWPTRTTLFFEHFLIFLFVSEPKMECTESGWREIDYKGCVCAAGYEPDEYNQKCIGKCPSSSPKSRIDVFVSPSFPLLLLLLPLCLINMMGLECTRTSLHNQRTFSFTVFTFLHFGSLPSSYNARFSIASTRVQNAEVGMNRDKVERNAYPLDFSAKFAHSHIWPAFSE